MGLGELASMGVWRLSTVWDIKMTRIAEVSSTRRVIWDWDSLHPKCASAYQWFCIKKWYRRGPQTTVYFEFGYTLKTRIVWTPWHCAAKACNAITSSLSMWPVVYMVTQALLHHWDEQQCKLKTCTSEAQTCTCVSLSEWLNATGAGNFKQLNAAL